MYNLMTELIGEWAFDNKTNMKDQTYRELMDKLQKLYENPQQSAYPHRHKVKISLTTEIKVASNEWVEGRGNGGDEFESGEDEEEETITLNTVDWLTMWFDEKITFHNTFSIDDEDYIYTVLFKNSKFSSKDHLFGSSHLHKTHIDKIVECVGKLSVNGDTYRVSSTNRY